MQDAAREVVHHLYVRKAQLPSAWSQVVLCASNWVVVKDCEDSFDPYVFAFFRRAASACPVSSKRAMFARQLPCMRKQLRC